MVRTPVLAIFTLQLVCAMPVCAGDDTIWMNKQARHFTEASPLGNGRVGAMIFGGPDEELIVLNESGMWSGSPQDADRPDAVTALPEIRRLLFHGKNVEAEELMNERFICAGEGSGRGTGANLPYGCYQTLGKLRLSFTHADIQAFAEDYSRELDLEEAVCRVRYSQRGTKFSREAFVSAPDQVLVIRLRSSKRHSLSFNVSLDRAERSNTVILGDHELQMTGQLDDGKNGSEGVRFGVRVRVLCSAGSVQATPGELQIRDATTAVLLISAATDSKSLTDSPIEDIVGRMKTDLDRAANRTYEELKRRHVRDYQHYYHRVRLRLRQPDEQSHAETPIDERLIAFAKGESDNGLSELYFNFGRYLLISSSRPGGRPANLQGIWAEKIQTPWNGDWHLNVNVQMNYWPAEICNLSDLHEPLFRLINSLVEPGSRTAQAYYGANGWTAHTLANPWGYTSPGEQAGWGSTNTCSAWLCQHIWDHYLFTQDIAFLRDFYPTMKGAAEFYLDTLVEHPKHGWLVTAPSTSPENSYLTKEGKKARICVGSTMDMQLLRFLFQATRQAATVLEIDQGFRARLASTADRLAPTRIAPDGRIMEWDDNYEEVDPQHRHVSHLWGLYPGYEIRTATTPKIAAAARKSLTVRGDAGTGWGIANKMALWARLQDEHKAYDLLRRHLQPIKHGPQATRWSGGTYPNLFCAHPPFQIDGNFGATAAIAETLLQSSPSNPENSGSYDLSLLPALPVAWADGEVVGLRARGGFQVGMHWEDGKLTRATLVSGNGRPARIHYGSHRVELHLARGETVLLDGELKLIRRPVNSP